MEAGAIAGISLDGPANREYIPELKGRRTTELAAEKAGSLAASRISRTTLRRSLRGIWTIWVWRSGGSGAITAAAWMEISPASMASTSSGAP